MPLFPQPNTSINYRYPTQTASMNMLQQANAPQEPIIVGVHGFESAKQFPTKPNQTITLHDLDADFEYVINTDINNQPSYKILEFKQISEEEYKEKYSIATSKDTGLPTAEEYKELINRIDKLEKELKANAKQPIQQYDTGVSYSGATTRSANNADVPVVKNK